MRVFDFNIHLPQKVSTDVNEVIAEDLTLTTQGLIDGLNLHLDTLKEVSGVNVLMFNQKLFQGEENLALFQNLVRARFDAFLLTALIDFKNPSLYEYLEHAMQQGIHSIMFNSYLQQISDLHFKKVLDVCKYAEAHKRIICIDGSFGTSKMYTYDNMKLACYIADHVRKVPIVLVHSGGYRIIEAMLLALDKKNVMLDTSFSLNYYLGSSLEQDYAFAYKRLGSKRVVFGSDMPYFNFSRALVEQREFFCRHGFSPADLDAIFYENSLQLTNADW